MDFKKQCAIFIDIDGTLKGSSREALEENLRVINLVRALGHKVFISTGRSTAYMPHIIAVNDNFDGFIAGSGTHVVVNGVELADFTVPYPLVKRMYRYFIDTSIPGILEGKDCMYYFTDAITGRNEWSQLDDKTADSVITTNTPIQKFSIYGDAPDDMEEHFSEECLVMRHNGYVEVTMKGLSKAEGIKTVISYLGIPQEQTIAIGDSMNDYEMLAFAGFSIAMGNAVDAIKNIADMICDQVDDAGLAKALMKIFEI